MESSEINDVTGISSGPSVSPSVRCRPDCSAPARKSPEMTGVFSQINSLPDRDPAPTTTCERGLGPIGVLEHKCQGNTICGRGLENSKVKLFLQNRDLKILKTIYEQQFLLSEQITRYFFKGVSWRRGYQRIQALVDFGVLRWVDRPMLDRKRLVRLTAQGLKTIQKNLAFEVPQVRIADVRTLEHDAIVTSVRLRLQEIWNGSWIPERAIKQEQFPRVPDGLFIFPSGKKVAVEVENTPKPKGRFLRLLEDWRRIDVKLVLFVATTSAIVRFIERVLPEGPQNVPFALVAWGDLERTEPSVWTTDGPVNIFSRKEY